MILGPIARTPAFWATAIQKHVLPRLSTATVVTQLRVYPQSPFYGAAGLRVLGIGLPSFSSRPVFRADGSGFRVGRILVLEGSVGDLVTT